MIEDKEEKKKGAEDKEEKNEGAEDKEEKNEGAEDKEEKKEGVEDKEEKKEGVEDKEEKKEGVEDKKEQKEGVEDKEEKKEEVVEEKEEKKEDVEDKENKENLFISANHTNTTNMTNIENKLDNKTIIEKKANSTLIETKVKNTTTFENKENNTEHNEKKENLTNLQNKTEENIEKTQNYINNRYKIQNDVNQENVDNVKENKTIDDLKVCLFTPARNENKYIKEYVEYYKKLGVDKIFIYDNNDENGDKFGEILEGCVGGNFVKIKNWRGINKSLLRMMNSCYNKYSEDYDWIIFSEVDDFIYLKIYTNIKDFLIEEKFDKCDKIYLNYIYHTDNDLYHYEDKPVKGRFPIVEPKPENKEGLKHNYVKSLLRGNLGNITITNKYIATEGIKGCNGYGEYPEMENSTMIKQDFENYYIDYYFSKSLDEFFDKLKDRDMLNGKKKAYKYEVFEIYCGFNKMNISKIEYIEKKTELNLTIYKNMLKENNKEN